MLFFYRSVIKVLVVCSFCVHAYKRLSSSSLSIRPSSKLNAVAESAAASLLAGGLAGSIGVGAAYPFDSIKTKTQTYTSSRPQGSTEKAPGMIDMFKIVYSNEGVQGFYSGVFSVMFGQIFIKASAFASNSWALTEILKISSNGASVEQDISPTIIQLCLAAAFSGLASSFVINPIERLKVMRQSDDKGVYTSDIQCIQEIIKNDSLFGLFSRGLTATLPREIIGNILYFVTYSVSMRYLNFPFLCGAMSGCMAWIPVYPFDVVKTTMQNTAGDTSTEKGMLKTALAMKDQYGLGVFYDGIYPKLIRATVAHGVTFYVYDSILRAIGADIHI